MQLERAGVKERVGRESNPSDAIRARNIGARRHELECVSGEPRHAVKEIYQLRTVTHYVFS